MEEKYCVYSHIDDNNVTFYIGIGDSKRPHVFSLRSKFWRSYVKKHCASGKPKVQIDHVNLTWEKAQEYEKFWISIYGRRDNGTGCLVNLTAGGDGTVGVIRSEETRRKIGDIHRGKNLSEETRRKIGEAQQGNKHKLGKKHSEESRLKLSEAKRGKNLSEEHKRKLSDAQRGKGKGYYFNKPSGKWCAQIKINRKSQHLGYFLTEAEAADAYKNALENYKITGGSKCII